MNRIAGGIIRHRLIVLIVFLIGTIICGLLIPTVEINYNLSDYVPENAPSTVAMHVMDEEFNQAIPNARVLIPNLTIQQAVEKKGEIEAVAEVEQVLWLDDFMDVKTPIEIADQEMVDAYYKDGNALYQVVTKNEDTVATKDALQQIAGEEGAVEGQLVDLASAQKSTSSEITTIMLIMVPLGVLILMVATSSFIAPLLLLIAMTVAIILNLGTNVLKMPVSFLTQAVTAVLQMAVSIDYGIFLLHSYDDARRKGLPSKQAVEDAVVGSANSIVASSLTTFFGFLALVFMQFQIGPDMGLVLAKGIIFSLLSVLILLPALLVWADPLIQKTTHRNLLPNFNGLAKLVMKIRIPVMALVLLLIIPAFLGQQQNAFIYGNAEYPEGSREARDRTLIEENFGKQLSMALLVPKEQWGKEKSLVEEFESLPEVRSILSYDTQVSRLIPSSLLDESQRSQLLSDHYSRLILTVQSEKEGEKAFAFVEQLRAITGKYYDEYHLLGENVVTYDMRETIQKDNRIVNGLAILTVGLVVLLSFKSLSIPILLVFTIEASIWFNLSVPYFTNTPLSYIGYLIISTVQLGATVDYAILYTNNYLKNRKTLPKKEAARKTIATTVGTLLPPALILISAGTILWVISSMAVVSELGQVLARGALFSLLMVVFFLPGLLVLFDGIIQKTTKGIDLYDETNGQ